MIIVMVMFTPLTIKSIQEYLYYTLLLYFQDWIRHDKDSTHKHHTVQKPQPQFVPLKYEGLKTDTLFNNDMSKERHGHCIFI